MALGVVHWDADAPPGTDVEIRTRTGDQLLQQIRYFDKPATRRPRTNTEPWPAFSRAFGYHGGRRPGVERLEPAVPAARGIGEFAESAALYAASGAAQNDGGQHVPALHRISVGLHQPVVQRLRAEVWPTAVEAGVLDTFALFVQPDFLAQPANMRSLGFDEVRVRAEPGLDLRLVDVALGTEAELASETPFQRFVRGGDGRLLDAQGAELAVYAEGDSLWLRFPETVQGASSEILAPVYYRSVVLGDEVPTGLDRNLLTFTSYSLLPEG